MKALSFLFFLFFSFSVSAMPDKTRIDVKYHADEIKYIHENAEIKCSQNKQGGTVLGCARDKKKITMNVDCEQKLIRVDIFSTDREIEILGEIPKDSCEFEEVLDHELTHMDLHAEALDSILKQGMIDVVDAFNKHFNNGESCQASTDAARKVFDAFVQKYDAEDKRINHDFDRDDVDSVFQNCKTPPIVEVSYIQPKIEYSAVKDVKCSREKIQCSQKNGKKYCSPIKQLSCTDMPISYKTDIKTYLGMVLVDIFVPEIKTKISSRYPSASCEYNVLKNYELGIVDEIEDVIYLFKDEIKNDIEIVYNRALEEEYSGEELNNTINKTMQKYVQLLSEEVGVAESKYKPLSEEEVKSECKRK